MKIRNQPRIKGIKREPIGAGALHAIHEAVEDEAARYRCSKSFVIATILAHHFNIRQQPDYVKLSGKVVRMRRRA